jgi:hypothetical protein
MRTNSIQIPLQSIALKTHTKSLVSLFIESPNIFKNPIECDDFKIDSISKTFYLFIKSIVEIWDENEKLISIENSKRDRANNTSKSPILYPQRDLRYQRTCLQIKLIK